MKKITLVLALFTLISYSQTQRLDKISFKDLDDFDNWTETSKMEFTYNADNIFIGEVISDIDDFGNWIVFYEKNITLDANNRIIEINIQEEDENPSKKIIGYNTNGDIDEIIYSNFSPSTNQYENVYKVNFSYDANHLKIEKISHHMNNSQWVNNGKTTYLYNTNNQLEYTYFYNYLEDIDEWETQAEVKTVYTHDVDQNLTSKISYYFSNDNWQESDKEEYSYDSNQNLIETIYSYWDDTQNYWIESSSSLYTDYDNNYDFNDLILPNFGIEEQDEINLFFNHKLNHFEYYYDGEVEEKTDLIYSDITANVNSVTTNPLQVYPNPFTNKVSFVLPTQKNMNLSLFDVQGKNIFNKTIISGKTIDLSSLESGVYFYDLIADDKHLKGKIIKQ